MIYCIKTNHGYMVAQGNRGKKTLLAFKEIKNARSVIHLYCECEKKQTDVIMIEKTTASSIIKLCKNTALDMTIMDGDISYCLEPDADYIETLRCAYDTTK